MTDNIFAIIPAGGVGSRALTAGRQIPKQYCTINGVAMLQLATDALRADARVTAVHIGVTAEDTWIDTLNLGSNVYVHRTAGATRAQTVSATLQAVLDYDDRDGWALVHDAARPGLQANTLTALIDACLGQNKGGLLALPVPDTVKRATLDDQQQVCVARTIPREGLWLAQTPQLFPARALLDALTAAIDQGLDITDEASAMEAVGIRPLLVRGSAENMKVTWPGDFAMMERWLTFTEAASGQEPA
ncbi:2-C-methyl-D-erythritol 4-phosphate cytidylyltransferase [Advenella incenata]|uniref:2-C-methyl-D-erythritol 4-phosphate cytidylyltransferase n=1 Tax=Advenella incenata TaxID=267800 RepID=A0A4Q7VTL4_9BURK|nr:2-C-methyl-D-erythritol 4-phosphate cytidylyltransferase [Advenella incenata]RZT99936.1 2-C-methyl-D-erythritol 4-phosphate cytidylyltransferase [Advenella incenata]